MNTPFSLVLGMTYTYLPFMILPLYSNLAKMDLRLLEAAADLGATAWVAFWKRHGAAVARRHHRRLDAGLHPLRRRVRDPRAARRPADADDRPHAVGRVLQQQRLADGLRRRGDDGAAGHRAAGRLQPLPGRGAGAAADERAAGSAFNRCVRAAAGWRSASPSCTCRSSRWSSTRSTTRRCANVWRGFTLKWYAALADDRELLAGLALSLKVAFATACASVVLGTLAAFALVALPALLRPHAVRRHGRGAAGHARGDHRPVAAADAGVAAARHRSRSASAFPSAAC